MCIRDRSEDDSVNLMAAQIAKSIFRREKVICRVSDVYKRQVEWFDKNTKGV